MQNIIVSDICDTLYYSNTTFDFIKYCITTKKIKTKSWLFRSVISKKNPLFWIAAIFQKAVKIDIPKKIAVSLLKGFKTTEVDQFAINFYHEFLEPRKIIEVHDLMNTFDKEDLVLASSTIEPVARVIAKNLQIPAFVATSLGIKNGRYTGKITREISGRKIQALTDHYKGVLPKISCAISDNYTDMPLIKMATAKYAVCYSNKDQYYWGHVLGLKVISVQKID